MNKKNEIISTRRVLKITVTTVAFALLVGALATGSVAGQAVQVNECQELSTQGETYEVPQTIDNNTITTSCLEITAPDIVLDGNENKVNGVNETPSSIGIEVSANNVTVKNFGNVTGWQTGIQVQSSDDVTLTDNTANNNRDDGINVDSTSDGELTDNTVNNNGDNGIYLQNSSGNDLIGNEANRNGVYGIWVLDESNFNDLFDNIARDNSGNAEGGSAGIYLGGFDPVNNNTAVNNTATGDQTYGIYLSEASDNKLRENEANKNNEAGIYLTQNSNSNELFDNVANNNGEGFVGEVGIYGIWLDEGSNSNILIGNEAFDNGDRIPVIGRLGEGEVEPSQLPPGSAAQSAGIYLGGVEGGSTVFNNTVEDNDVGNLQGDGFDQAYGIWLSQANENRIIDNTANENLLYGIWLSQGSSDNRLIDNIAEDNGVDVSSPTSSSVSISDGHGDYVEGSSGIYIGGIGGPTPTPEPDFGNNRLVDNTARGSEYGIWIRNSFGNNVSESLAEDNYEGIAVEMDGIRRLDEEVPGIALAGNTFTDDTSRNNEWDFVADVPLFGPFDSDSTGTLDTDIPTSFFPVTNLNIGSSTKPDTTLSFFSPNIRLRSVRSTQSDPAGLTNIGRYFEAERTVTEEPVIEQEELPPLLFAAVSYEDADVSNVDESTLELRRYNETAGEWQVLGNPLLDQANNLVAGVTSSTSNFGVFGEGGKTCINRRDLGRGQEESECPFDRDIERGGTREGLDRDTGRGGGEEHRDSETARRNRGRGEGRSR